jgi:hypothetical protein
MPQKVRRKAAPNQRPNVSITVMERVGTIPRPFGGLSLNRFADTPPMRLRRFQHSAWRLEEFALQRFDRSKNRTITKRLRLRAQEARDGDKKGALIRHRQGRGGAQDRGEL